MIRHAIAALFLIFSNVPTSALASDGAAKSPESIANTAFTLLEQGKSREAINETLGRSPMMARKTIEIEPLATQIDAALKIYGPAKSFERVFEAKIGTLMVRQIYLVQHDMMLTRWQLDFGRLPSGWALLNISFDDQVKAWEAE